jgi:hypothetical protein
MIYKYHGYVEIQAQNSGRFASALIPSDTQNSGLSAMMQKPEIEIVLPSQSLDANDLFRIVIIDGDPL